jgi:hypothetical protein
MKLFIVPDKGDTIYYLLTEEGECLASHMCSNAGFAKGDLEAGRPERQKEWKERFGEYTVQFLSEQKDISEEELIKRNQNFSQKPPEDKAFKVSIEVSND